MGGDQEEKYLVDFRDGKLGRQPCHELLIASSWKRL